MTANRKKTNLGRETYKCVSVYLISTNIISYYVFNNGYSISGCAQTQFMIDTERLLWHQQKHRSLRSQCKGISGI